MAACLLTVAVTSCTDDSNSLPQGGTTTIRLNIPMLEAATRITTPTEEQETEIKTLRVIISNSDKAYINKAFTEAELSTGTLTIRSRIEHRNTYHRQCTRRRGADVRHSQRGRTGKGLQRLQ